MDEQTRQLRGYPAYRSCCARRWRLRTGEIFSGADTPAGMSNRSGRAELKLTHTTKQVMVHFSFGRQLAARLLGRQALYLVVGPLRCLRVVKLLPRAQGVSSRWQNCREDLLR